MKRTIWLSLIILLLAAACRERMGLEDLPTVANIDRRATDRVLTQNAPPPGYRESIAVPRIDQGLEELAGWHYEALLMFDGVFARTPRTTTVETEVQVWFNQLASARRVVVQDSSALLGEEEDAVLEGVRMGPDSFLVIDGVCQTGSEDAAETVADLNAGDLLGGVRQATPAGANEVINSEEVWRYDFEPDALMLPNIQPAGDGEIIVTSGELWFAPQHDAVVRFYLNLEVENVVVLGSELPVSGEAFIRYDLMDVGEAANISVPFGC